MSRGNFLGVLRWKKIAKNTIANISSARYNKSTPSKTKTPAKNMTKLSSLTTSLFKRQLTLVVIAGFFFGSMLSVVSLSGFGGAQSIDELREQSSGLEAQIEQSEQETERLTRRAAELEDVIRAVDYQIGQANSQIESIGIEINTLERKLIEAEEELERQKELLKMNMRALYRRGGATTVELLMASDSFSDFIDEQEYLERLKGGIQDSTNQVMELQEQMEKQKAEQEELLAQQESARQSLVVARQNRENLLQETRGEEQRFREKRESLLAEQKEIEEEIRQLLLAGTMASEGYVEAGQMIGRVGTTGFTFGAHLHFELLDSNFNQIDPLWGPGTSLGYGLGWPLPSIDPRPSGQRHDFGCQSIIQYHNTWACPAGQSLHAGIDIPAVWGTPIVAAKSGEVRRFNGYNGGWGNMVVITHDDGTATRYAHLAD